MSTKLKRIALIVGLGALVAVPAVAMPGKGGGPGKRADRIAEFDKNNDGQLDDAERAAMRSAMQAKRSQRLEKLLARYDLDKDGTLSDAERSAMHRARAGERFKKLDTDGNGVLSFEEFAAAGPRRGFHGGKGHRMRGGHK